MPLSRDMVSGKSKVRDQLTERLSNRGLEDGSIFSDGDTSVTARDGGRPAADGLSAGDSATTSRTGASLAADHVSRALDPDPRSRVRWERRMVIRDVGTATDAFSREPRAARLARTERALLNPSSDLPTSVKKLVHLARQISGKTVDDALTQMRYSKKKMAREVIYQLEMARDRAIAERGMGLGRWNGEAFPEGQRASVRDKKGNRIDVDDPTRLYVAEAWVGRCTWRGRVPEYRARGKVNTLMKPSTRITIRLKEEKTRIREHEERELKARRQGPWVHLPDRPVTAQRQYYSW